MGSQMIDGATSIVVHNSESCFPCFTKTMRHMLFCGSPCPVDSSPQHFFTVLAQLSLNNGTAVSGRLNEWNSTKMCLERNDLHFSRCFG